MSHQCFTECRKCCEEAQTYMESKSEYLAELCQDEDCRYFFSEEKGKLISEGVMDMDEYQEHNLSPYFNEYE